MENPDSVPPVKKYQWVWIPVVFSFVLVITFVFSLRKPVQKNPSLAVTPTSTIIPKPSPTPPKRYSVTDNPAGENDLYETQEFYNPQTQWLTLSSTSIGLSFEYPVPAGIVKFSYAGHDREPPVPKGWWYNWSVIPIGSQYGSTPIASGISADLKPQRDLNITDFYQLPSPFSVHILKTYQTKYGTKAQIVDFPSTGYDEPTPTPGLGKPAAILADLPFKNLHFKGIAIILPEEVTSKNIQRIISSLIVY